MKSFFDEINACQYLFLRDLLERDRNSLTAIVEEARAASEPGTVQVGAIKFSDARRITSEDGYRKFRLHWDSYVAYSVTNESFGTSIQRETFEGSLLRRYLRSRYLDFVRNTTIASDDYPGKLVHVGLLCQDHIVDVISVAPPEITRFTD
jgi:hypothetical protein